VNLQIKKPFFNSQDTYNDVEKLIREKNIITSRDSAPIKNSNIEFYKDGKLIVNKNTKLSSEKISIRFVSNKTNKFIIGESKILDYIIPYYDLNFNIEKNKEFINFGNESTGYWALTKYEKDKKILNK